MTTCPQCGTQNLPGMAYCEHCGAPLEQEAAPAQQGIDPVAAAASAQAQSILDSLNAGEQTPAQPEAPAEAAPEQQETTPQPVAAEPAAQAPEPDHAPVLALVFPDGSSYTVANDVTNVGRSDVAQNWHPELDLIPFGGGAPDLGVSRHQALIQREGTTYHVVDVGSTNGTFVNGKALAYNKPVELHDGDALAFGAFNAKVSIQ
jgi:pSer/pThr/pTyr-binding forkhead associated (FHA) protein